MQVGNRAHCRAPTSRLCARLCPRQGTRYRGHSCIHRLFSAEHRSRTVSEARNHPLDSPRVNEHRLDILPASESGPISSYINKPSLRGHPSKAGKDQSRSFPIPHGHCQPQLYRILGNFVSALSASWPRIEISDLQEFAVKRDRISLTRLHHGATCHCAISAPLIDGHYVRMRTDSPLVASHT